jgi:hypothetical protein
VDSVNIYQEDSLLEEGLTADMMLIKNSDAGEYERELTLYFPDDEGRALSAEIERLTISADKPLAEYIKEELLRAPRGARGRRARGRGKGLCRRDKAAFRRDGGRSLRRGLLR